MTAALEPGREGDRGNRLPRCASNASALWMRSSRLYVTHESPSGSRNIALKFASLIPVIEANSGR